MAPRTSDGRKLIAPLVLLIETKFKFIQMIEPGANHTSTVACLCELPHCALPPTDLGLHTTSETTHTHTLNCRIDVHNDRRAHFRPEGPAAQTPTEGRWIGTE